MEDPLITAVSRLTGLSLATGTPDGAALREHQDLWAIGLAAFAMLKAEPDTAVITPEHLIPYVRSVYSGDKRSKKYNAVAALQVQRVRTILARTPGVIYVTKGRSGQTFSLTPPMQ